MILTVPGTRTMMLAVRRVKYPRTLHLPWSPGVASDDKRHACFKPDVEVAVTEKMDGENTSLYRDYIHARSLDGRPHASQDWVRALQGRVGWRIPEGWRVCGENLYARHAIAYEDLTSYFQVFNIWNESNVALSWTDTLSWAGELGLQTVPVLYRGPFDRAMIHAAWEALSHTSEGYVVRPAESVPYDEWTQAVGKYVRAQHVQPSTKHWSRAAVIPNKLA